VSTRQLSSGVTT